MFKHWYTSLFGLMAGLPGLLQMIGMSHFGHVGTTTVDQVISAVGVAVLGAVAADASKTPAQ